LKPPLNILLFIDSLTGAGAQRQLTNLAVGLKSRNHTVLVATYAPLDFFLDRIESQSIEYECFHKRYRFDLSPAWKLHQSIKRFQPDVVVAFLRTPSIYAEISKTLNPRMNLIVSERAGVDLNGFGMRDRLASIGHLIATRVTTNSHDYLQHMITAMPYLKKRSSVIYNGLDGDFFQQGKSRINRMHKPLNQIANTTTRFVVVANRANRQKAPTILINALLHLKENGFSNFTLDWVGSVDFQSDLVVQVNDTIAAHQLEQHWRWRGDSKCVADVYPYYDALVLPSLYEGVANTLCEAMCCALPVIATDIADNRQLVESAEAGLVCGVNNPTALAKAMQSFMQLSHAEKQRMCINAYRQACEMFDMKTYIDRWESLCYSTLQNR